MQQEKLKADISAIHRKEWKKLILSQQDVLPHENRFFIQILEIPDSSVKVQISVERSEWVSLEMEKEMLSEIKKSILDMLNNPDTGCVIYIAEHKVEFVHFDNGVVGLGIGKGKYLLTEDKIEQLKSFVI